MLPYGTPSRKDSRTIHSRFSLNTTGLLNPDVYSTVSSSVLLLLDYAVIHKRQTMVGVVVLRFGPLFRNAAFAPVLQCLSLKHPMSSVLLDLSEPIWLRVCTFLNTSELCELSCVSAKLRAVVARDEVWARKCRIIRVNPKSDSPTDSATSRKNLFVSHYVELFPVYISFRADVDPSSYWHDESDLVDFAGRLRRIADFARDPQLADSDEIRSRIEQVCTAFEDHVSTRFDVAYAARDTNVLREISTILYALNDARNLAKRFISANRLFCSDMPTETR